MWCKFKQFLFRERSGPSLEGVLHCYSHFFGFCKFRIYEDDAVQEGKSVVKDNEVAVNDLLIWWHG